MSRRKELDRLRQEARAAGFKPGKLRGSVKKLRARALRQRKRNRLVKYVLIAAGAVGGGFLLGRQLKKR